VASKVSSWIAGFFTNQVGIAGHSLNVSRRRKHMRTARLLSLVVVTVLLFVSVPVGAQQPVAPPPPQIPYGAPISFEQAKKVMASAEAEAMKNKWNMVIAILDTGGHLVMLHRLDGTQLGSIEAAKDKAYSAVLYRRPTKVFQDLVGQGGPNLRLLKLAGASPLEGGIPLIVDGKIIGAVGVSGAASEQDAQVAKAGADALTK
jgi:glc operon protein GlcG